MWVTHPDKHYNTKSLTLHLKSYIPYNMTLLYEVEVLKFLETPGQSLSAGDPIYETHQLLSC